MAENDKQAKKPVKGIYDPDLDLGYQLKTADALNLGRDVLVVKKISSAATLSGGGKGGLSGSPGSGNGGPNYGAASNSGDNTGMNSSGTSSQTGVPTSTGLGSSQTGSAGTDSDSGFERKQ